MNSNNLFDCFAPLLPEIEDQEPAAVLDDLIDSVEAEAARRSFKEFIIQAWPVLEPGTPFIDGWHIDAMVEHLEAVTAGQINRLLINIPPGYMKSLGVSVFWPGWEWISHPANRYLCFSYAAGLAIRDAVRSRRVIESAWYRRNWGDVFYLTTDQNQKTRFENSETGFRVSMGILGGVTGERGNRLILDDGLNVVDSFSPAIIEKTNKTIDQALSTRLSKTGNAAAVGISQRLNEDDPPGHLMARETGWTLLKIPLEYDKNKSVVTSIGWKDPRKRDGELICPAFENREAVEKLKKDMGSWAYAAQCQQEPAPAEGAMIKRAWFNTYRAPLDYNSFELMISTWDLPFKGKEKMVTDPSFVSGQALGVKGGDIYLMPDEVHDKLNFPKTCDAFESYHKKYGWVTAKLVEDAANGPALKSQLERKVPGILLIDPCGNKIARMAAASPVIEAGNLWIPHSDLCPWIESWIQEVTGFPSMKYKDRADALSQGIIWLMENYIGKSKVEYSSVTKRTRTVARKGTF